MRCNIIREPEGGGARWVKLGERDVDFQNSVDGFLNFDGCVAVIISVGGELFNTAGNLTVGVNLCAGESINAFMKFGSVDPNIESGHVAGYCFFVWSYGHGWVSATASYDDYGATHIPDALCTGGGRYNGIYGSFRGHQTVYGLKLE